MPKHVVVDGSNIATEGRNMPSLRQLNEAVLAFMEEHPTDLITVVVDATFGHRIDAKEVAEFDEAIANNELVCPPAGAVGRGDAFVLSIANKVGATILSNDSFQEFHGDYAWLFDDGRLLGGKPVLHVGWVFVPRTPVRGPISRKAVKAQKGKAADRSPRASSMASQPMPVPKAPPPGRGGRRDSRAAAASSVGRGPDVAATVAAVATSPAGATNGRRASARPQAVKHADAPTPTKAAFVNEPAPFLAFVGGHPVGAIVEGTVDSYSSHGAYLVADGARCYVPLRYMASPAPRAARDVLKLGGVYSFVVASFNAGRRSIDVTIPGFEPAEVTEAMAAAAAAPTRKRRSSRKVGADTAAAEVAAEVPAAAGSGAARSGAADGDGRRPSRRGRGGRSSARDLAAEPAPTSVAPAASDVSSDADAGAVDPGRVPRRRATAKTASTPPAAVGPTRGRKAGAKAVATDTTTTDGADGRTGPSAASGVVPAVPAAGSATGSAKKGRAGKLPVATDPVIPPATPAIAPTPSAPRTSAPTPSAPRTPAPTPSAPRTPAPRTPAPKTPAPRTPAPRTPAPTPSAPKSPAPKTPVPKTPAPRTPVRTTPVRTTPVRKAPAQKVPAAKTPAGKVPAQKVPAAKTPAGKVPAGRVPAGKTAIHDPAVQQPPTRKAPARASTTVPPASVLVDPVRAAVGRKARPATSTAAKAARPAATKAAKQAVTKPAVTRAAKSALPTPPAAVPARRRGRGS